ncbi:ubiquitin thioesterase otubain-like [Diabrotica virgifera virgifera]|uniref:Ubiquitin thioesterase n=1 Tax=Diabrotica virgifera virgifera TaxID=50390 RepID=A0A6P7G7W5_DIAVI|nr:ubiquitin thioesterase otubain-like [Diabrotica virgifera virgifera]
MGDQVENSNNKVTENDPQPNRDEMIMAQQRQIEQEISESIPLLGGLEPVTSLNNEYSSDDIYLEKVSNLASKYQFIRRTRPDGNCFFRAFLYANIERLLKKKEEFELFFKLAEASKDALVSLGFQQFTVEDFYDTYIDVLRRLKDIDNIDEALKELYSVFNDQGFSDYLVVYLRLLTSGQLQKEHEFYSCFIEGDRTVADFCHQEVEPMYKESDHIHIIAACAALNTGVRVVYMDRGTGKICTEHDLPEGCTPTVHLLYRPGHYDILYQ